MLKLEFRSFIESISEMRNKTIIKLKIKENKTPQNRYNTVRNFVFGPKEHNVEKGIFFYRRGPRST